MKARFWGIYGVFEGVSIGFRTMQEASRASLPSCRRSAAGSFGEFEVFKQPPATANRRRIADGKSSVRLAKVCNVCWSVPRSLDLFREAFYRHMLSLDTPSAAPHGELNDPLGEKHVQRPRRTPAHRLADESHPGDT